MNHALVAMNDHKERFLAASKMSRVEADGVSRLSLKISLMSSIYVVLFIPLLRFPQQATLQYEAFIFLFLNAVPQVFELSFI